MSTREVDKLKILHQHLKGGLLQREAAAQMQLSTRQVRRLCRRVEQKGNRGIIHGLRGHPSNHQLQPGLLDRALKIIKAKYHDFGPTFANEKLGEKHGVVP